MRWLSACVIVAALATLASSDADAKPRVRTYTVQPGDSIWSIAAEFYGSGDKYRIVYRYNKFIGPAPHILKPGQVLTLPEGDVSPEAQVAWTKKEVRAKPPRSLDWLQANTKMNLWKQYQVSTGDESAVHIVFEDESDLSLGEQSLLVIYGGSATTAKRRQREKTQVLLREGTVRGGLAALDDKTPPMQVETPSGVVDVSATDMQIQCDETSSAVSVYEGEVTVKAQGETVKVPKDHGTVVAKGNKPEAPRPLPAPPGWSVGGDGAAVAIVPLGGEARFEAAWSPVARAKTYKIELAEDERFKNVAVSVEVDAKATRFVLENVPVGRFYARVSARDERRLQGRASRALQIDVVGIRSSRRMTKDESGRWEVVGFARLDLGTLGSGLEWALDDGAFTTGSEPQRVLGFGKHTVKVRRAGEAIVTRFDFHVLEVRARLDLDSAERLRAGEDDRRVVTLTLSDERGRPTNVPEVLLEAEPGGIVPLEVAGPGVWRGTVLAPAPPGPREIALRARWPDGTLATERIDVERKLLEPYVYRWAQATQTARWDNRLAATELPSVVPIDRVGLEVGGQALRAETIANLALRGEVAAFDRRLALDGTLAFFRLPVDRDVQGVNELGDLTLGVRYLALTTPRIIVAPSLRARLPLGRDDGVGVGLEPSALVRFRALETLWLDTRQGIFGAFGDAGEASYIGDYALLWMPLGVHGLLGLTAQLDTAVSFSDAPFASGLALGVQLHLSRVRVGFELGLGLGDGGRARYGDAFGALTLDFGLGTP